MANLVISGDTSGSVTLSAPAVSGTTVLTLPTTSGTIVTTGSAASLTTSGNLTFTGTGNRILGDFSNATLTSRVAFQTSTTNSQTVVGVIPNGTSTVAQLHLFSSPDYTNYSRLAIQNTGSVISFLSDFAGTGSYLPMTFQTGGSERVRIDTSGNVGIGTSSPVGRLHVSGVNDTGGVATFISNTSDIGNTTPFIDLRFSQRSNGADGGRIRAGRDGIYSATTSTMDSFMAFYTAIDNLDTERMRIDSSGNVLVGKTSADNTTAGNRITGTYISSAGTTDFYLAYSTISSVYRFYVTQAGTVFATNTTISAISDQRLKENIQDIDVGLDKIMSLKPRKFDWKAGKGKDIKGDRGWIAQEFETVFPEMIGTWKDEPPEGEEPYKSVCADLIPVLVKAIQEQQALITQLQLDVAALKGTE